MGALCNEPTLASKTVAILSGIVPESHSYALAPCRLFFVGQTLTAVCMEHQPPLLQGMQWGTDWQHACQLPLVQAVSQIAAAQPLREWACGRWCIRPGRISVKVVVQACTAGSYGDGSGHVAGGCCAGGAQLSAVPQQTKGAAGQAVHGG